MSIKVVVGLGNPGKSYTHTRHNVGYRVLDQLENEGWKDAVLFRPDGFMNTSGHSVATLVRKKGLNPSEILVICDDFAIPLGSLRIRFKGSSGGHNGLNSILECLGTQEVPRMRVGIGPVPVGQDPADFVLATFSSAERSALDEVLRRTSEAVRVAVEHSVETAMNRYNKTMPSSSL